MEPSQPHQQPLSKHDGKPLDREILAIAIPAIVSNITTPLLSLIDVAIVGHIGNAVYIGAIAVGGAIFNMLYWLFGFLRMGSSGLTAQAFGASDRQRAYLVMWRGFVIALVASAAMIALSSPLADTMLRFMADSDAVTALARRYFLIAIWGAPAVLATYTISGWLLGMQNSRATMVVALTTNIVNIIVSLILVFGMRMDIAGVAIGTLVAQWVGLLTAIVIVSRHYGWSFPPLRLIIERSGLKRFFNINVFIFLRTLCLVAVTLWFTHVGALGGPVILAANTLLMQLFLFFSYFMDGFAFAGEAVCGKYFGAADNAMLKASVRGVFRCGLITAVVFTVAYFFSGEFILGLLTDDRHVVDCAREYLSWAITVPLVGMATFAWDGIFVGLTRTRSMMLSVLLGAITFFAIYILFFPDLTTIPPGQDSTNQLTTANHILWLAFLAYLLVRGLVLTISYHTHRPK